MPHTFRAADVEFADDERRPLAPPSAVPLSGPATTYGRLLGTDRDGLVVTGTWECEPSTSRWEFDDRGEFIHVLRGRMTCTEDGHDPVELGAGSTALFPLGWHGTWEITETLRKVFTVYRAG